MSEKIKLLIAVLLGCVLGLVVGYLPTGCGHDHDLMDTEASLMLIMSAIEEYRKDTGNYPSESDWISELKANAKSQKRIWILSENAWSVENPNEFRDGWGTSIEYSPNGRMGGGPVLTSAGPDGDMTTVEDNMRRTR